MNNQFILEIALIVLLIIIFIIWLVWQIKKKGLKEVVIDAIIEAEDTFEKGKNDEKFNSVVEKVIALLPKPFNILISTTMVESFVQRNI
jgi:uncharacterized ion transporter superfamily protein YfcC